MKKIIIILFVFVFLTGCSYKKEDNLYLETDCYFYNKNIDLIDLSVDIELNNTKILYLKIKDNLINKKYYSVNNSSIIISSLFLNNLVDGRHFFTIIYDNGKKSEYCKANFSIIVHNNHL